MNVHYPVIVNKEGEGILPYPRRHFPGLHDRFKANYADPIDVLAKPGDWPDSYLSFVAGVHYLCSGWIDVHQVSETHQALLCRRCGRIVTIPIEIDTFSKLVEYFKEYNGNE